MENSNRITAVIAAFTALLFYSHYGLAGAADMQNKDGTKMKFEYQGDNLRVNTGQGDESYMLLVDQHMYMVSTSDGNTTVIDMNQAMSMFGGMAGAATPSVVASEVVSMEATGRSEVQAGITGEVYNLRYIDDDSREHRTELLLSDDPRPKAFSRAMNRMALTLAKSAGKDFANATGDMDKRLAKLDKGVLRYGDDMVITAISDRKIDPSRFVLPAEPTELPNLGDMFKQSSASGEADTDAKQKNGGVVSSFLGALGKMGKKPEAAEDDEEAEDNDEEQEGAEKNSLGKAFGKFFGK